MSSRAALTGLFHNRFVWVAVILIATVGAVVLVNTAGSDAEPTRAGDVRSQILGRMRTTLEKADPGQHNHGGHNPLQGDGEAKPPVICGVHVYGFEPIVRLVTPEEEEHAVVTETLLTSVHE